MPEWRIVYLLKKTEGRYSSCIQNSSGKMLCKWYFTVVPVHLLSNSFLLEVGHFSRHFVAMELPLCHLDVALSTGGGLTHEELIPKSPPRHLLFAQLGTHTSPWNFSGIQLLLEAVMKDNSLLCLQVMEKQHKLCQTDFAELGTGHLGIKSPIALQGSSVLSETLHKPAAQLPETAAWSLRAVNHLNTEGNTGLSAKHCADAAGGLSLKCYTF